MLAGTSNANEGTTRPELDGVQEHGQSLVRQCYQTTIQSIFVSLP